MTRSAHLHALASFLWLAAIAAPVAAETAYVSDRFEIGVHEKTDIDSIIVAVVPSGTPLEVIGKDGEFVEVRTPDGTRGWVDARYLVNEMPSSKSLAEYDAKLQEAVRSLGAARAEVEVLRQRVTELQRDAATAPPGLIASANTENPASAEAKKISAKLDKAESDIKDLAKKNRELNTRIADLQAAKIASAKSADRRKPETVPQAQEKVWRGPIADEARSWTPWQWLLFASILLLAFAAGGYAVDWDSRRRHGGFRI